MKRKVTITQEHADKYSAVLKSKQVITVSKCCPLYQVLCELIVPNMVPYLNVYQCSIEIGGLNKDQPRSTERWIKKLDKVGVDKTKFPATVTVDLPDGVWK